MSKTNEIKLSVGQVWMKYVNLKRCMMNEIDWSKIPPEYKWAAMDKSGQWYAYTIEPNIGDTTWFPISVGLWIIFENPAPDWTTSLQKRPEEKMSEIELKVGQIWEDDEGIRREIVAVYDSVVAYKVINIKGNNWCAASSITGFIGHFAHKLVDS